MNTSIDALSAALQDRTRDEERAALDALPSRPGPPRGHVSTFVPGTREQVDVLDEAVRGLHSDNYGLLVHLLDSGQNAPLSARFRQRWFRRSDPVALRERGMIDEPTPYSRARGLSRTYSLSGPLHRRLVEAGPDAEGVADGGRVNLVTRRPTARRVKSRLRTAAGHPLPGLVRGGIEAVGPSPFNAGAIEDHLGGLRETADRTADPVRRGRAEARYLTDRRCYQAVLSQGAAPDDGADPMGTWTYRPAYAAQRFGRIGAVGGGLQACSRAMKARAYDGVQDVHNLDLVAAQPRALSVLLGRSGHRSDWLDRYVRDPDAKRSAARAVGVPISVWKTTFYAIVMGAATPPTSRARRSGGSVARAFESALPAHDVLPAYARFLEMTAPLRGVLRAWHRWLVREFVPATSRRNNVDGKRYVRNRVGATVAVEDLARPPRLWALPGRLAAFLCQGVEAALVHSLAASAADHGFKPVSHEHDGLVVVGTVPPAAVSGAARAAGMPLDLVSLVEKPFEP